MHLDFSLLYLLSCHVGWGIRSSVPDLLCTGGISMGDMGGELDSIPFYIPLE